MLPCPKSVEITINIINTNNTDNIKVFCTCGSGKKYKNCCGKNAQHLCLKRFTKIKNLGTKLGCRQNLNKKFIKA